MFCGAALFFLNLVLQLSVDCLFNYSRCCDFPTSQFEYFTHQIRVVGDLSNPIAPFAHVPLRLFRWRRSEGRAFLIAAHSSVQNSTLSEVSHLGRLTTL